MITESSHISLTRAKAALKQYFGYDEFRPMQDEIIAAVLEGKDSLVLMPTGGGKSLCFQIPAIIGEGVCIVVSPLIALMKDQVDGLKANGVPADFLNSSQQDREQMEVLDAARRGETKLLYVSPEKLLTEQFIAFLHTLPISLFAIDEAHCISSWGHDFRPEYTKLSGLKAAFPSVPLIALTATADKLTRKDITTQLSMNRPKVFIASFDRPNLSLSVLPGRKKLDQILNFLKKRPNTSGIIYCLSRAATEDLAEKLVANGFNAGYYHAGLERGARAQVQNAFINDIKPIICATIAFGMGIDKSNIRWVIHYNLPKNMEGYYQEIGRAGRDSLPSDTLLFYSLSDVMKLRGFVKESSQREVQLAKLQRIQQYAEALICRRKILLAYFGEHLTENCGNCDVCKDPPTYVDGTLMAQKALSAIYRLQESVPLGIVIDVLRGSAKKEILEKGYNKVKTYGAGSDINYGDWQQFLLQMLNLGLFEIAYDQGNVLKLTPESHKVLFENQKVQMYRVVTAKDRAKKIETRFRPKSKRVQLAEDLFETLVDLRKHLAANSGIAPHLVFTDVTLREMAAERPSNEREMKDITGMSEAKFGQYGRLFIEEIIRFVLERRAAGANIPGSTYLETFSMYQKGLSVSDIAQQKQIHPGTVYAHIGRLFEQGYQIDPLRYISNEEVNEIEKAMQMIHSDKITDLAEVLEGKVHKDKIRLGMSYLGGRP